MPDGFKSDREDRKKKTCYNVQACDKLKWHEDYALVFWYKKWVF